MGKANRSKSMNCSKSKDSETEARMEAFSPQELKGVPSTSKRSTERSVRHSQSPFEHSS